MKISEAFALYRKNEVLALGKSNSTKEWLVCTEKLLITYLGDISVRKLNIDDVHNFYLWVRMSHAQNTASEYLCKIRAVLAYCQGRGIKVMDPKTIKTPKKEKKLARFLTNEEFEVFLSEAERSCRGYSAVNRQRNILMIKMLFYTGLRVGELCSLNRNSIQDRQFAVVGKSKYPRPCYITRELEVDIDRYLALRKDDSEALFVANQNGERMQPNNVQRVFRRVSKGTTLGRVTPHTLRHSYATRLVEDGVDVRYVAALLGHQSLETTKKYTHIRDCKLREVYENAMKSA